MKIIYYLIHYLVLFFYGKPIVLHGRVFGVKNLPKPALGFSVLRINPFLTAYIRASGDKGSYVTQYIDINQKMHIQILRPNGNHADLIADIDAETLPLVKFWLETSSLLAHK